MMDRVYKLGRRRIKFSFNALIRILPGAFYIANMMRMLMMTGTPYLATLYTTGVIGYVLMFRFRDYRSNKLIFFFFFYLLSLFLNWMTVENITLNNIIVNVFLIGITILMLLRKWTYHDGIVIFYVSALLILYSMNTSSVRRILISSTNYISVVLLLSVAFYYTGIQMETRKLRLIDIAPAIICFLISIWARGRGGILSTAFLLFALLLIYMKELASKNAKRTLIAILILFLIGIFLILSDTSVVNSFMRLGKWETRGIDTSNRTLIWSSYVEKAFESFEYFFVGAPLKDIFIINQLSENCHNSFLQLHAYTGILFFLFFCFYLYKSLAFYWKNRQYIGFIMLLTLIIRGMTDKFIFGQYGMPIVIFLVLYPFVCKEERRKARKCILNHS